MTDVVFVWVRYDFFDLTLIGQPWWVASGEKKKRVAEFKCFCGTIFNVDLVSAKTGNVRSCGCFEKAVLN